MFIFKDVTTASHVFLRHGALRGALQAPYVGPYRVLHRGEKTYTIDVQGSEKTVSIDRLKPAYVLHVHNDTASPPAILSSITTRSGRRYAFRITWGCPGLIGGWCGDRHRLSHPLSQDIASPTHCSRINTATELRVNRQLKSRSVCVGDASAVQQQASGRLQSVYARGEVVLSVHTFVRVQVCCVLGISYLYRHTFIVLPLGSYTPMPAPSPPFKTILELVLWNGLQCCHCITPDVISVIKMPSFQYFLYLQEQKKSHWELDLVNRQGVPTQLFV